METGKSEFLTHKQALLFVDLIPVPKCPQILSQVHPQRPLPRDHIGPQMEKSSFPENECLLSATEMSGAN